MTAPDPPGFDTSGDHWFRAVAETASTAILVLRETFLYVNPAAEQLLGASAEELSRLAPPAVVHPDYREVVRRRFEARLRGEDVKGRYVMKILRPDGQVRWVDYSAQRIALGSTRAVLGTAIDITDSKRHEQRLRRLVEGTSRVVGEDFFPRLVRCLAEAFETRSAFVAAREPSGRARMLALWTDGGYAEAGELELGGILEGEHGALHSSYRDGDGKDFPLAPLATALGTPHYLVTFMIGADGEATGALGILGDQPLEQGPAAVSLLEIFAQRSAAEMERLEALQELSREKEHDPLTGLINRRSFEGQLEAALSGAAGHVLCILDLDEFQLVNDTFGPAAGDEMLQRVAGLVRRRVREDDVVARLGSDEFGILFKDCSQELARRLTESIRDGLGKEELERHGKKFACSAGFGLVPFTSEATGVAEVLTLAHGACFLARRRGRNQIHEVEPGDEALAARLDEMGWVHRIRSAFDEDRFLLYHQPFAALGDHRLPISEIFLRLDGEGGVILPPGALIQAAERYHLISRIDRWVVKKALATLGSSAEAAGDPERIYTINLSGRSLGEKGFLADVSSAVGEATFDPRRICFEITETAAIANLDAALRFFTELRALGCRFLLDDFGSGMSSLAYLKNLPVDYLKIDGEFVSKIVRDPVQRAMVESIHRISRVLGLKTIGECVEGEESLEALRGIGIDYAQGFWLAEPVPLR